MKPSAVPVPRGRSHQVTLFLGISLIGGVLTSLLLLPVVGAAGVSAREAAEGFQNIPSDLVNVPIAQRSRILDNEGNEIAVLYERDRVAVPLTRISKQMQQAVLAIEDSRFYQHGAVDLKGIVRALATNAQAGDTKQGASTLTQQFVKNALIEQADGQDQVKAAREQTIGRKIREMKYALALEQKLPKDKILENYLNVAFFGNRAYGVQSAAYNFFNTTADKLTLPQAALLAGVVRNPVGYDPEDHPKTATERRNLVLSRMAELKYITGAQAAEAKKAPLGIGIQHTKNGCAAAKPLSAAWFCDYVTRVIENDPAFGETVGSRRALLRKGGLTIRTTLDPKAQEAAYQSLMNRVNEDDPVAGVVSMVEPGTGAIKAMVQSRPYKRTGGVNLNVGEKHHGSHYGFQAGSTFKVFVAAAAIKQGIRGDHSIFSPRTWVSRGPFKTCNGTVGGYWDPSNETASEHGSYTMAGALADSINTYFAQLERETGICDPLKTAQSMGVRLGSERLKWEEVKSFTLGVNTVTPLSMAEAYATFAARGKHCDSVAITEITDMAGKKLPVAKPKCEQVMDEDVADTMNTLLQEVIKHGSGSFEGKLGRPAAGKTGTTQQRRDVWFIGYTPQLSAAVWVGSLGTADEKRIELRNIRIGGQYYARVSGARLPTPIWRQAMLGALSGTSAENFVRGPRSMVGNINPKPKPSASPSPGASTKPSDRPGRPGRPGRPDIGIPWPPPQGFGPRWEE